MEGNDLGTYDGQYYVVIMEPTLVDAPPITRFETIRMRRGSKRGQQIAFDNRLAQYRVNPYMARWIVQQGYQFSMRTEVWQIGNRLFFDELAGMVDDMVGEYVFSYEYIEDVQQARDKLTANPRIHTVYDADRERIELYWKMRGYSVQPGQAP